MLTKLYIGTLHSIAAVFIAVTQERKKGILKRCVSTELKWKSRGWGGGSFFFLRTDFEFGTGFQLQRRRKQAEEERKREREELLI